MIFKMAGGRERYPLKLMASQGGRPLSYFELFYICIDTYMDITYTILET